MKMAARSPSPSPSSPAVTDCPQCQELCVGASILPCGHLTCRKCLRDHHGSTLTCATCRHALVIPKGQGHVTTSSTQPSISPTLPTSVPVDPMMSRPVKVAEMSLTAEENEDEPWITSIITRDDKLVMADWSNSKIKVALVNPPAVTATLTLDNKPWRLALLQDGGVAATTYNKNTIYLLKVTDDAVTVTSRLHTDKCYCGIAGNSDGSLIVSCGTDSSSASVDLINRDGRLLRTVASSREIPGLESPSNLTFMGDQVLVNDWYSNRVYRVKVETGELMDTYTHTKLKGPEQVCTDSAGHVYIASLAGECVLVRDRRGQWRVLLTAEHHGEQGYSNPVALCVTSTGHVVVGWDKLIVTRIVIYKLN